MWSMIVVVLSPVFNLGLSVVQRQEPVFVQTLGANSPVERLDESVIRGFAGATEVESDLIDISPLVQNLRRELRAVVDSNRFRKPTSRRGLDASRPVDPL